MKPLLALIFCLISLGAQSQIKIEGTIQIKSYYSMQQMQEITYSGSGYWQRGPAVNTRLCIDVLNEARIKVADIVVYTDTEGKYSANLNAKKNYYLIVRYECNDTPALIKEIKVKAAESIRFDCQFKLPR